MSSYSIISIHTWWHTYKGDSSTSFASNFGAGGSYRAVRTHAVKHYSHAAKWSDFNFLMQQELTAKVCGMSELSTWRTILLQLSRYWHVTKIPKWETNPDNSGRVESIILDNLVQSVQKRLQED